jgi:hypothetical protein
VNWQSTRSAVRKTAGSVGFGNFLLALVLVGIGLIFLETGRQGRAFSSAVTAQTGVLQSQAGAIEQQSALQGQAIELLGQIVAGQQSTAKALLAGDTGGGQIKVTSWKYRDPETGACMTFQVTTTQAAGESFEDFQARHFLAVRTDKALMPPDPTCP